MNKALNDRDMNWSKIFYISLIMINLLLAVFLIKGIMLIKVSEIADIALGKIQEDNNKEFYVEWIYKCPDYVSAHFNCPNNLQLENITGKYCNGTLVCENNYKISNYTKFTGVKE